MQIQLDKAGGNDYWSSYLTEEVVRYIAIAVPPLWEKPPLDTLNLTNGLLDVNTRQLRHHDPTFLSPIQLPVTYNPDATCPAWEQFVSQVFPEDAQPFTWELVAYLMLPNTDQQKAVLLLGDGGNGKSTFLAAVLRFLGTENVTNMSIQHLTTNRFTVARLLGKLANISPDLPSVHLADTSTFKLLTGGDRIPAERKYEARFEFTPYARLVFAANHPPQSADSSEGFFERWLVVPFTCSFRGDASEIPRSILDARLAQPDELSGVLNKALDALPQLRNRGFTISPSMRAAVKEFRGVTDPLVVWLERYTPEEPGACVKKSALLDQYNQECERKRRPPMTDSAFSRALKKLRPALKDGRCTIAGKQEHVWLGIRLDNCSEYNEEAA